jgi:hypothetical protein
MGTTYTVYEKNGLGIELHEGSDEFSLMLTGGAGKHHRIDVDYDDESVVSACTPRRMKQGDLIGIALELLKVASYFGEDEMKKQVDDYLEDRPDADYYRDVLEIMTGEKEV